MLMYYLNYSVFAWVQVLLIYYALYLSHFFTKVNVSKHFNLKSSILSHQSYKWFKYNLLVYYINILFISGISGFNVEFYDIAHVWVTTIYHTVFAKRFYVHSALK